MKHILYFLLLCTVFSMAEITNGIVNADVTAGEFISQATTYETNGDYLNAAINYKKAGNEYAIQAINYKSQGLNAWTILHTSAKECYSKALLVLDRSPNDISTYYKSNIEHRINDLNKI